MPRWRCCRPTMSIALLRDKFQAAVRLAEEMLRSRGQHRHVWYPGPVIRQKCSATSAAVSRSIRRACGWGGTCWHVPTYMVREFKEKPDTTTAKKYPLESGEYYWNSGIFMWRAETILDALRDREPDMMRRLDAIEEAWDGQNRDAVFEREFAAIRPISIDFAVMEHAKDVAVIEAPFQWDDLGGWQSLGSAGGKR